MVTDFASIISRLNVSAEKFVQDGRGVDAPVPDELVVRWMEWMSKKGFVFTEKTVKLLRIYLSNKSHGMFLCGGVGIGKTFFFATLGIPILNLKYATHKTVDEIYTALELHQHRDILVDDIGDETKMSDYGVKKEILSDILDARCQTLNRTHFTSNISDAEIRARYGDRVWDRLAQLAKMYHLIDMESRRTMNSLRMAENTFENFFKHPVWPSCRRHCYGWDDENCCCAKNVKREPDERTWESCARRHGFY